MAKPKNMATRTYVCQGRLNRGAKLHKDLKADRHTNPRKGTKAHEVLKERRIEAGILFDATINRLVKDHPGKTLNGNESQLLATIVANELGVQRGHLQNRCRIATVQKAVNAWNNHVNHDYGLPTKYDGQPVRTIDTFAHNRRFEKPLIIFTEKGNPKLVFPGLPSIKLYSYRQLPDDQPTYASVSVDGRKVKVSLVYRVDQKPLPQDGKLDPYDVLGLDIGITEIIAASQDISYQGIAQKELDQKINQARRLTQAMVRKACKAGLAGFRALLDENKRQILTNKETPRRYLHWTNGQPTKQYRRAAQCLSRLLKQRTRQRKAYRHQVAAAVVKYCVQHGIQLISMENLNVSNMTKSPTGTVENPAKRAAQKHGLNRRILEQGWITLINYIQYKARREGIHLRKVHPGGTSQTCSNCGYRDKNSREKKLFHCVSCDYQDDADRNAALNIGDRGTYIFVKRKGATMDDIRLHRLARTSEPTPERQEPGTGLDDETDGWSAGEPHGLPGFHPAPQSDSSLKDREF